MWSIEDVSAERLAKLAHHYRKALKQPEDHETDDDKSSWEGMPHQERRLMVAAMRLALLELASAAAAAGTNRAYFATPGEAEWGC